MSMRLFYAALLLCACQTLTYLSDTSCRLLLSQAEAQEEDDGSEQEEDSEQEEPMGLTPELLAASLLQDQNGSGFIEIAAFGDSIARGVGDFEASGQDVFEVSTPNREAGYPLRVEGYLDLPVSNFGDPGERISTDGLERFARFIPQGQFDIVVITGGADDAIDNVNPSTIFRTFQTLINIARASNTEPVITTIPPTCCDHAGIGPRVNAFNDQIRRAAAMNSVALADILRGFDNTCVSRNNCYLLNLPEGLHPNIEGYDVFGEIVTATLLSLNIFDPEQARLLENALLLPTGSLKTAPDPFPAAAPEDEQA